MTPSKETPITDSKNMEMYELLDKLIPNNPLKEV